MRWSHAKLLAGYISIRDGEYGPYVTQLKPTRWQTMRCWFRWLWNEVRFWYYGLTALKKAFVLAVLCAVGVTVRLLG